MPRFQVYAIILTAIVAGWAVAVSVVPSMSAGMRVTEDFKCIPSTIGDWSGTDIEQDKQTLKSLPTCSVLSRRYNDYAGNSVELSIVYGRELGDFHQPEICMEGSGWKRTGSETMWLHPKGGKPHQAKLITMTNDYQDIVIVYWFYMGGKISYKMDSEKLTALFKALLGGDLVPSAMVKFVAPIIVDEETSRKSAISLAELLDASIIGMAKKKPKYEPSSKALE
jgi:EpsI family protein